MKNFLIFLSILMCSQIDAYHQFQSQYNSQEVLDYVRNFLPENPTIIECGAYNGDDTIRLATYWPRGFVHAFEPIPSHFENILNRTKEIPNVMIYELVLSDTVGTQIFYLSNYQDGMLSGSSSLLPPKEHLEFDKGVFFNQEILVNAVTLDHWGSTFNVSHIDFMWLDMQGFELNMLKDSALAKTAKVIYIEVEFVEAYEGQYLYKDVKEWMLENGYDLVAIDFNEELALAGREAIKPGTGIPYFGNAVFVRKNL